MGRLPGGRLIDPGDRAVRFINNLTLSDDFQGQPFTLRPWQEVIVRKIFGSLTEEGLRQYRRALFLFPRKQAKTQLAAAIADFCILGAGLKGQTILLAASDREQASHLFEKACEMIEADSFLSKQVRILESKKRIETRQGRNVLKVISADGRRQHGQNPSVVILDEVHTQPNRKLHDALVTAFGTRREPLMILISTAGNERGTLIHDEYVYACNVRDGKVIDPSYLPVIYEASPEDDWTDEKTWAKAMPALGDFVPIENFRLELARAKADPSQESAFKQYYLNLWVAAATKWLNREAWELCGKHPVDWTKLKGKRCYAGLDLANTSDLAAFVLVFPMLDGSYQVLWHGWIPEGYATERDAKGSNTKYLEWSRMGLITLTDGHVINHKVVFDKICELGKLYKIEKILADPWNCAQMASWLTGKGFEVEMFRQGFGSMNEPTKHLGVLLAEEKIHHGNNAVANWQADNAVTLRDGQGNIKFDKESSAEKIDLMVALVMALAGALLSKPKRKATVSFA